MAKSGGGTGRPEYRTLTRRSPQIEAYAKSQGFTAVFERPGGFYFLHVRPGGPAVMATSLAQAKYEVPRLIELENAKRAWRQELLGQIIGEEAYG